MSALSNVLVDIRVAAGGRKLSNAGFSNLTIVNATLSSHS